MQRDPLHQHCRPCPHFGGQGCLQMKPPSQAGQQLLDGCTIPPEEALERLVGARLKQHDALQGEAESLCFEVRHSFGQLQAENFQAPQAGARLVLALLRTLVWRKAAALLRRRRGRIDAASCQWYRGVRGTGSFCDKGGQALPLDDPQGCPKKPCFAPFQTVSREAEEQSGWEPSEPDGAQESRLEQRQIREKIGLFVAQSPVLGELFCQLTAAPRHELAQTRRAWARRYGVTEKTVENWRHRASALFLAVYTGALNQLESRDEVGYRLVKERDFTPTRPLPSGAIAFTPLGASVGLSASAARQQYKEAWSWMKEWMIEHGYPEARELPLPLQERADASRTP